MAELAEIADSMPGWAVGYIKILGIPTNKMAEIAQKLDRERPNCFKEILVHSNVANGVTKSSSMQFLRRIEKGPEVPSFQEYFNDLIRRFNDEYGKGNVLVVVSSAAWSVKLA